MSIPAIAPAADDAGEVADRAVEVLRGYPVFDLPRFDTGVFDSPVSTRRAQSP